MITGRTGLDGITATMSWTGTGEKRGQRDMEAQIGEIKTGTPETSSVVLAIVHKNGTRMMRNEKESERRRKCGGAGKTRMMMVEETDASVAKKIIGRHGNVQERGTTRGSGIGKDT